MGPPQLGQIVGNNSSRCSGAVDAGTDGDGAGEGETADSSVSKARGADCINIASRTMLIAINTKIPGHHHPFQAKIASPISHTAPWRLRQGPTSFFLRSRRLITCSLVRGNLTRLGYRYYTSIRSVSADEDTRQYSLQRFGVIYPEFVVAAPPGWAVLWERLPRLLGVNPANLTTQ